MEGVNFLSINHKTGTKVIFCCYLELVVPIPEYQGCPCCLDSQSENGWKKYLPPSALLNCCWFNHSSKNSKAKGIFTYSFFRFRVLYAYIKAQWQLVFILHQKAKLQKSTVEVLRKIFALSLTLTIITATTPRTMRKSTPMIHLSVATWM